MSRGKWKAHLERTAFELAGEDAPVNAVRMVEAVFTSLPFSYTRDEIVAMVCDGDYLFAPLVPDEIGRAVDALVAAEIIGPVDSRGENENLYPTAAWDPPHTEVLA